MRIDSCNIIQVPKISDQRGNLSFIEAENHVPFPIKRVFYVYDIPSGQNRGAHAHKTLEQFIFCVSGGVEVFLDDGHHQKTVKLNRPWEGLYIPPMIWTSTGNFYPGTSYIVLASDFFHESDYFRIYDDFLKEAINEG